MAVPPTYHPPSTTAHPLLIVQSNPISVCVVGRMQVVGPSGSGLSLLNLHSRCPHQGELVRVFSLLH